MVASVSTRPTRAPVLAKYEVLEELGHGGMATVYRAHDKRLARDVAIKVLHPHLKEDLEIAHRFAVEARAVAKLRHPNIVEVFDVSEEEDAEQCLVVELVRGETLRTLLHRGGALPPEIAAAIGIELLSALAHAHAEGVVHRDLKPENVLIEVRAKRSEMPEEDAAESTSKPISQGACESVAIKLTDFGIAKLLDAQGVTSTGQVLGSPAHMAPEQIEGGEVDGRADVFGLGVLLYECMVGHLPFEGNNPAQVLRRVLDGQYSKAECERTTVGKGWSQILDRALARDVDARFAGAAAMHGAISTELTRLGFGDSHEELAAYFDDPQKYAKVHQERLVARLCELGAEARKCGDVVASAADYNRALAYAPTDPELYRIVSTVHRTETRNRFLLRRALPLVVLAAAGACAFFAVRALRSLPTSTLAAKTDDDVMHGAPSLTQHPKASAEPSPSNALPASPTTAGKLPQDSIGHAARASGTSGTIKSKHKLSFGSLQPPAGILASIDGARAFEITSGLSVDVSNERHTVAFSCKNPFTSKDLCEVQTHEIAPSEIDQRMDVRLKILPATLLVEGDVTHSYRIEQWPSIPVIAGQPVSVPMRTGSDILTVFDNADDTKRNVRLEAGRSVTVSFK
ncbi:MAG: serine/threonine protein kinase [Polyangiaceae bacterium]|nr:serine/threonine protein kinase [Polyangiaceae bacterium]